MLQSPAGVSALLRGPNRAGDGLARKLTGMLQSPAEVSALLREQNVPEDVLACAGPEIPPRLDATLRDTGNADYLRPAVRGEVDAILHGSPSGDRLDRAVSQAAL